MSVPTYEAMMRPTLEILSERGPQQFRQLAEMVADGMQLTGDDRAATIESGQTVYVTEWAGRSPKWCRREPSADRSGA